MAEGRIPPQSIEAEQAVLGALLTTDDAFDMVHGIVKTEDFYRDAHRVIYEALIKIISQNHRADLVLLVEELRKMGKLDDVGGIAYVTNLPNYANGSFNVDKHARVVSEKANLRRLIDAGNKIVGMCYSGEGEPESIVNDAERMVLAVTGVSNSEQSFSSIGEIVVDTINTISENSRRKGGLTGLSTGFRRLDKITNGLQQSDLILVAARPSMGKTAFTLNIAQHAAVKDHKSVAFFSLEMSKEQLVARILSSLSGVNSQKLKTGQLQGQEWEQLIMATQALSEATLYIDDTPGLTVQNMRSKLRRLKSDKGLDLVVVDYIQLMQGRNSQGSDNRQQEISEISRNLKLIARELDVPILALSQLSRSVESRQDKRPVLSDLRESGSLEQDADIVMFLYRENYYDPETEKGDVSEVIIRKHRNGELGNIELIFQGEFARFRDVAYQDEE